ncbi:MAG: formylglycine-generating enzyme family protein [Anaerolineae bacterium]|jgi:formylglycine-generating enzyme required for sulfatase activity|nr:formylglycine-generating enzyme family protein [Anaerolineae bacterium]
MTFEYPVCTLPTGVYPIGDPRYPVATPVHEVSIAACSIGLIPVTNAHFEPFLAHYHDPTLWTVIGWRWLKSRQATQPAFWDQAAFNAASQPVVGVSWYEAHAFSRWISRETGQAWRLPSEIEWEAAAKGHDPVTLDPRLTHTAEWGGGSPWPVGRSMTAWCGALDLFGNVWEWTLSQWGRNWQTLHYRYPYRAEDGREQIEGSAARVMRGGSYFDPIREAHPAQRGRFLPGSRASNIGFRLVCSL